MTYLLYIIMLGLTLLCPTFSNADMSSANFKLEGIGTASGSGNSSSASFSNSGILIGRQSAFSGYSGSSMTSGSYTFTAASATLSQLKSNSSAPTITSFIVGMSSSLTAPVISFAATSGAALAGYMITESPVTPSPAAKEWSATIPASYTFSSYGTKTLYGWAKNSAGKVSAPKSATVALTAPVSTPLITVNSVPLPYYGKSITLSGSWNDTAGVSSISVKNGTAPPVSAIVGNGTWSATIDGLLLGANTIIIDATNNSGNHSTSTINLVAAARTITLKDALWILHVANIGITPTADQLTRYDLAPYVNGRSLPDGVIDVGDAIVALQILVGTLY